MIIFKMKKEQGKRVFKEGIMNKKFFDNCKRIINTSIKKRYMLEILRCCVVWECKSDEVFLFFYLIAINILFYCTVLKVNYQDPVGD